MKTTRKNELIRQAAKSSGFAQKDVSIAVEAFLNAIKTEFKKGNRMEIRGFGVFYPYIREAREYTVPRIGDQRIAEKCMRMKFKASRMLDIGE